MFYDDVKKRTGDVTVREQWHVAIAHRLGTATRRYVTFNRGELLLLCNNYRYNLLPYYVLLNCAIFV